MTETAESESGGLFCSHRSNYLFNSISTFEGSSHITSTTQGDLKNHLTLKMKSTLELYKTRPSQRTQEARIGLSEEVREREAAAAE